MARRMTKAEGTFWTVMILIGLMVGAIVKVVETMGPPLFVGVMVAAAGLTAWYKVMKRRERMEYLMGKYNDEYLVERIMEGCVWNGQTAEQLRESIGQPVEVDEKRLKTKRKEVWKYNHQGANRYGLRITVENGIVVGWDKKAS